MTIASYGYAGTIMPGVEWAEFQRVAGSTYAVADPSAALATPVVGGVEIGAGIIGGQGVVDIIPEGEPAVPLVAPGTGIEYHVICAHRDWQVSGATTMVAVSAGTSLPSSLPVDLDDQPGIIDDQPLWMVSMAAGSNTPVIVWDLRQIGGPNVYQVSEEPPIAMFAPLAEMGVILKRSGLTVTRRVSESSGNGFWDIYPREFFGDEVFPHIPGPHEWGTTGGPTPRASLIADGTAVDLSVEVRRQTGGDLAADQTRGGVNDLLVGNVTIPFRPRYRRILRGTYEAKGGGTYGCDLRLEVNGNLYLIAIAPNTTIGVQAPTAVTLWATAQYAI